MKRNAINVPCLTKCSKKKVGDSCQRAIGRKMWSRGEWRGGRIARVVGRKNGLNEGESQSKNSSQGLSSRSPKTLETLREE